MAFFLLLCVCYLPAQKTLNFCAVRDILLNRGIARMIKKHGIDYPSSKITQFIQNYDLAFCNLECPISARGKSTDKTYCFRADTSYFIGVKHAGYNVFSLQKPASVSLDKFITVVIIEDENA